MAITFVSKGMTSQDVRRELLDKMSDGPEINSYIVPDLLSDKIQSRNNGLDNNPLLNSIRKKQRIEG